MLNADDKDLLCKYYDRVFKCLESVQGTTDAELCVILCKEYEILRKNEILLHTLLICIVHF